MEPPKATRKGAVIEPQPLFDAIGRVAFESAGLERAYSEIVAVMALGGLSIFFTKGAAPAQLKQVVEPLLKNEHIPEPYRSQAREVLLRADQLLELRNHVIHGQWLAIVDELGVAQYSTHRAKRHAISDRSREWTIPELHRLAQDMYQLKGQMFNVQWNICSMVGGSGMPLIEDKGTSHAPVHIDGPDADGSGAD